MTCSMEKRRFQRGKGGKATSSYEKQGITACRTRESGAPEKKHVLPGPHHQVNRVENSYISEELWEATKAWQKSHQL